MSTTTHGQTTDWDVALKLLNERYPILVESLGTPVRERVQWARATTHEDGRVDLEVITYRGRHLQYRGIASLALVVTERDKQGVPIAYELHLRLEGRQPEGSANDSADSVLRFRA